ncbi:hypothetical protein MRX96_007808 [Rhipicephalus microplus]
MLSPSVRTCGQLIERLRLGLAEGRKERDIVGGTVEFDDVFAEPEGTYSLDGVWKAATLTFTHTKNICYRALSLLCAVPLALIVGISFACLSFQHIWCIGPAIRHCRVNCHVVRQYMRIILESCCAPCFSEMGLVLSRIRVLHLQNGDRHHMESI